MNFFKISFWAMVFTVWTLTGASVSAIVYVDGSRPGGNGSSWSQAYRTLEAAVNASAGQEIWVAQGVYTPNQIVRPLAGTQIFGGFVGNETQRSQRNPNVYHTTIDGQLSLKHVIEIRNTAPNVRIDGFRIVRGRAVNGSGYDPYAAGIFLGGSGSVVANTLFSNNVASVAGGALLVQSVPALIENCQFYNNSSPLGGAIALNETDTVVSNCLFVGNVASGNGDRRAGAIWINKRNPRIYKSTFVNNSAYQG